MNLYDPPSFWRRRSIHATTFQEKVVNACSKRSLEVAIWRAGLICMLNCFKGVARAVSENTPNTRVLSEWKIMKNCFLKRWPLWSRHSKLTLYISRMQSKRGRGSKDLGNGYERMRCGWNNLFLFLSMLPRRFFKWTTKKHAGGTNNNNQWLVVGRRWWLAISCEQQWSVNCHWEQWRSVTDHWAKWWSVISH